jgi:hypothetical protein
MLHGPESGLERLHPRSRVRVAGGARANRPSIARRGSPTRGSSVRPANTALTLGHAAASVHVRWRMQAGAYAQAAASHAPSDRHYHMPPAAQKGPIAQHYARLVRSTGDIIVTSPQHRPAWPTGHRPLQTPLLSASAPPEAAAAAASVVAVRGAPQTMTRGLSPQPYPSLCL